LHSVLIIFIIKNAMNRYLKLVIPQISGSLIQALK
jgi:hypothetical protein